jgi:hypothetical protein
MIRSDVKAAGGVETGEIVLTRGHERYTALTTSREYNREMEMYHRYFIVMVEGYDVPQPDWNADYQGV